MIVSPKVSMSMPLRIHVRSPQSDASEIHRDYFFPHIEIRLKTEKGKIMRFSSLRSFRFEYHSAYTRMYVYITGFYIAFHVYSTRRLTHSQPHVDIDSVASIAAHIHSQAHVRVNERTRSLSLSVCMCVLVYAVRLCIQLKYHDSYLLSSVLRQ